MKQRVLFIVLLFLFLSRPITQAQAACQIGPGKQFTTQVTFYGNKDNGSSIAVGSVTRFRPPAQCTTPIASNTYTISCDETTETLAADSIFPPLCGSGVERGKANSTCYQCGAGVIKCDGFDGTLGQSSNIFNNHQRCPFDQNNSNWSGDVRCSPPDQQIIDQKKFTYNGTEYKYNGELIVSCGSNNQACGASEECVNRAHSDVNNRGNSGSTPEKQCTTVTRTTSVAKDTDINLKERGTPTDVTGREAKNLIDVGGDNDRARGPQLSTLVGNSVNTSPDIKGLFQVNLNDGKTPIPKDVENGGNFGVTLLELGTNPNDVIRAPKIGYDIGGGYNYTILYASENDITLKGTREDNAVYGYTIHLTDFNINPDILRLYNQNQNAGRNQLLAIPCGYPLGTPKDSKVKVAVADTGTFMDPRVRKDWWNTPTDVSCTNISPGLVNPLPTQVCTVAGAPKIPSKARIPNLVSPDRQNSNPKKYTVTGVTFPKTKLIKGLISLANNILKYPVMSTFATMLDNAMPALQPLAIQLGYQKLAHPLTITADTKVCVESEDGEVRARPIKNDIKTEYKDLNKLVGATSFFASILGLRNLSKYEQNNMAKLHPDLAPGAGSDDCPDPPKALNVREMAGPSGGAEFDVPEERSAKYKTPSRWIPQGILDNISKLLCLVGGSADCNTNFDPQYYLNLDLNTPYLNNVNDDVGVDNQTGKHSGFVNSFAPGTLQKYLGNDPGKAFHKVNQNLGSNSEPVNIDLNFVNAQGIQTHERFLRCAITPQSKQNGDACTFADVRIPNTSDWASSGTISSAGPPEFTPSGPFADLLKQKATQYGVPQCVMEGVGRIEGGGRYSELPLDRCLETTNTCSAVGPMQFTIGAGHGKATEEACKNSCGAGYCPNAWSTWGKGGNPCRYEDALDAAARYLAAFGHFSGGDQKDSIHDAATAYYGSDNDETARKYLKGCEYWEFVYKQCNPSYVCGSSNVGL